jgi:outer membrane protein assembly factor BamB
LIVGDGIYVVTNRGVASCLDAKTGEIRWTERLGGNYSASPLELNGKIYIFSEEGKVYTLEPANEYKLLATGELEGRLMASPAVADGAIFVRSDTHLYRIEEK